MEEGWRDGGDGGEEGGRRGGMGGMERTRDGGQDGWKGWGGRGMEGDGGDEGRRGMDGAPPPKNHRMHQPFVFSPPQEAPMGMCRIPPCDARPPPAFSAQGWVPSSAPRPRKKTLPSFGGLTVPTAGWGGSSEEAMAQGVRMLLLGPSPRLSCGRKGETD